MNLTKQEKDMLNGGEGKGVQKAMEILVALGEIYGAERMVEISSSQVSGVSYKNLGDAGIEFLNDWAYNGARVRVKTTLNPCGMDLKNWKKLGISEKFAENQLRIINAFKRMGIKPTCTCTPYFIGNKPKFGEHIAWSESSAVSYANSVLGARTNRESGISALASAICGRTPMYGYHLDENRKANLIVNVECELGGISDFGALGYIIGKKAGNSVPYFIFKKNTMVNSDKLKSLGAAMAASGAVSLYHIKGITPEAGNKKNFGVVTFGCNCPTAKLSVATQNFCARKTAKQFLGPISLKANSGPISQSEIRVQLEGIPSNSGKNIIHKNSDKITIENLDKVYKALNSKAKKIDLVAIGCPHASIQELIEISKLLKGKKIKSKLWIATAGKIRKRAEEIGIVKEIEKSGAFVVSDTCMIVAPIEELGFRTMATNAAKAAFYAPSYCGVNVRFGSLEDCIEAAVEGKWRNGT